MSDQPKYFPVNWIDGMKINKEHFIAQDAAMNDALHQAVSVGLSPVKYGVLPPTAAGENTFSVTLVADNQNSVTASVLKCRALTPGGIFINIPGLPRENENGTITTAFQVAASEATTNYYVVLVVHPFDRLPAGSPDLNENPPRYPFTQPSYKIEFADEGRYRHFAANPYALTIGRLTTDGNSIRIDEEYIPPCISLTAHPDLLQLHAELDQFLSSLELRCSLIVQKIFKRNQQNELSDLTLYLCDRIMLYLAQAITSLRRTVIYEPPIALFANISGLARVMKNTIDLRIGSGKDQLLNYLSEWSELKQGELEIMLSTVANLSYNHNDINTGILPIVRYAQVTTKLFETLSTLEFIGKRRDSGGEFFVKEEFKPQQNDTPAPKPKRKFFGGTQA
jgi:hypothetical protein